MGHSKLRPSWTQSMHSNTRHASGLLTEQLPKNLITDAGELLSDFESIDGWAGQDAVVSSEAVLVKEGSKAMRLTANGGVPAQTYISGLNVDASALGWLDVWVYASVTDQVNIMVSSATGGYQTGSVTVFTGWNHISKRQSDMYDMGGGNWNNPITSVRFVVSFPSAGAYFVFDDFRIAVQRRGAVVLTFDDGWESHYTEGYAYGSQHGIRGTVYKATNTNNLILSHMQEMYAAGWDIANHTDDHGFLSWGTQTQQEGHLLGAKAILDDWGFTRSSAHVAYPYGDYNDATMAAMAASGMLTGRLINPDKITDPIPYRYRIPAYIYISGNTLNTLKGYIDNAVNSGSIYVFFTHQIIAEAGADNCTPAIWQGLCDYIVSSGIPAITISELYALQSSPVIVPIPH